jgi:hypothetical protein
VQLWQVEIHKGTLLHQEGARMIMRALSSKGESKLMPDFFMPIAIVNS